MVKEKMLIIATNKVGTEVYFLGNFGRQTLQRDNLPNVDYRPDQYQDSIVIRSDNRHRVRNKRQATARTSFINKQQEPSTKKRAVSHHRQQRRLKPPRNQNTSLKKTTVIFPMTTSMNNPKTFLPVTKNLENPTIPHSETSVSMISWIQITPMKISDQFEMAATHILHSIHSTNQDSSL
jgi:hypothetical protein